MIMLDIKKYLNESDNRESLDVKKYLVTVQIINGNKTKQKTIETTASSESQAKHQVCDSMGLPISAVIEVKDKGSLIKESLDSDAAGDAYYKVNEASLKLQEVKPYIEEGSKQEVLYNKIMIDLNELQVSFTEESINEESLFKDVAGKNGIHSYMDMVYGQEPDSEYARLIQEYMKRSDSIRLRLKNLREKYKGDPLNKEFKKMYIDLANEDKNNFELLAKAEKIPENERGQMYQDYLEISKANDDEFANQRGYKNMDDYMNSIFHESVDPNTVEQLRSAKYYNGEGLVQRYVELQRQRDELEKQGKLTDALKTKFDDKIQELINKSEYAPSEEKEVVADIPDKDLPVDLASQGRCPYCTRKMSKDEYRVFGMCKHCYDNGVE